jgi:hypothetical protein
MEQRMLNPIMKYADFTKDQRKTLSCFNSSHIVNKELRTIEPIPTTEVRQPKINLSKNIKSVSNPPKQRCGSGFAMLVGWICIRIQDGKQFKMG